MTNPLDTKVPPPATATYLPFSTKLPTQFGGKWPAWSLLRFIHYGFLLIRRLQNLVKRLQAEKLAWASTYQVAAQANGAPKRGPHSLKSWLVYFWRYNWDRQKENKALAARVATLERQVAALVGSAKASLADVKDEIDKAQVRAER